MKKRMVKQGILFGITGLFLFVASAGASQSFKLQAQDNSVTLGQNDVIQGLYYYKNVHCEGFKVAFSNDDGSFMHFQPSNCSSQYYLRSYDLVVRKTLGCPDCTGLMKVFVPVKVSAYVKSIDPDNQNVKVVLALPEIPESIPGLQPEDCGASISSLAAKASDSTSCQPEKIDRRALYDRYNDGDIVDRKIMFTGVNVAWDGIGSYEQTYWLKPSSEIEIQGSSLDMRVLKSSKPLSSEDGPWLNWFSAPFDKDETSLIVPQQPYNPAFADEDDLATLKLYFYGEKTAP